MEMDEQRARPRRARAVGGWRTKASVVNAAIAASRSATSRSDAARGGCEGRLAAGEHAWNALSVDGCVCACVHMYTDRGIAQRLPIVVCSDSDLDPTRWRVRALEASTRGHPCKL